MVIHGELLFTATIGMGDYPLVPPRSLEPKTEWLGAELQKDKWSLHTIALLRVSRLLNQPSSQPSRRGGFTHLFASGTLVTFIAAESHSSFLSIWIARFPRQQSSVSGPE